MNYIYVDNYRGFSNSLIPIKDVNFLVGENSTGKTSILGLLQLLSPMEFWLTGELDTRKVGFGTFKDVVSVDAKNKTAFWVGIVFDRPVVNDGEDEIKGGGPQETSLVALVMRFVEHDGVPKMASLISYRNGIEAHVKYTGNDIKYKANKTSLLKSAREFCESGLQDWIESKKRDGAGFSKLADEDYYYRGAPPVMILSFVERKFLTKNEKAKHVDAFEVSSFFGDIAWLAPIRSKPRKTYDEFILDYSPEGDHTPYLIKKKMASKNESERFNSFMRDIGEKSGLFKELKIKNYGRGASAPFELDVVLDKHALSVGSVGYGVSQSLPVIVEIFSRHKNSWFSIQQPEVHLHPKAQAALGEAFFSLAHHDGKKFIIETHSDYTIDRFRVMMRKEKGVQLSSQILFFSRTEEGNAVYPIEIHGNGEISDSQPDSYREFFIREEMDLLGI